MSNTISSIKSPCILVCSMDMETGFCFGCGRTRDEIAGWVGFSHELRDAIMEELPTRVGTIKRKPRRITKRRRQASEQGNSTPRKTTF